MKTSMKVLIGIGIILIILVMSVVGNYNGLVTKNEAVETALSEIDNQLQRRNDLIPNLVETVKRYAAHEEEIFTNIAEARAKLAGAGTLEEAADASAAMTGALSRLLAIAENYPDLKANTSFINLQDNLSGTENRIALARGDYNKVTREYNTAIRRFPTNLMANMFGFSSFQYFEASEGARENPDVGDLFGD